jgi:hypothetical protein
MLSHFLGGTPAGGPLAAPTPNDLEMLRRHLLGEEPLTAIEHAGVVWMVHFRPSLPPEPPV